MFFDERINAMPNVLELKKIDKRFGTVHALKEVSLDLIEGETMSLVGENGAGKSTLMKILTGVYTKNSGEIYIAGKLENIIDPSKANELGIGQVYQQAELVPELTVAENIFLGEKGFGIKGWVSWKRMYDEAKRLLKQYDIPINEHEVVGNLNVANQQLIAIAKVIQRNLKILILDEPTAVLSDKEVELLFKIIDKLKAKKITIIYISHKLDEVFRVSDRMAVLRDGELITVLRNKHLTKDDLIKHILGRNVNMMFPEKKSNSDGEILLKVKNLNTDKVHNISFELKKGEILGIAGLVGSGRTELARAIYGLDPMKSGEIWIQGAQVKINNSVDAVRNGLFLAPEDRRGQALVLIQSIGDNISLANLKQISHWGFCNKKNEMNILNELKSNLNIKAESVDTMVGNLSGGNQQKVVIAKAIIAKPKILIVDEPTQGIDVGAKSEIYFLLKKLVSEGMSIIFISSEMEELQGVCSRLIVMNEGNITGEIAESNIKDSEGVLNLMYRSVN